MTPGSPGNNAEHCERVREARKRLDAEIDALRRLKHGGFRLGEGKIAQAEAQRRRVKIAALRQEWEALR